MIIHTMQDMLANRLYQYHCICTIVRHPLGSCSITAGDNPVSAMDRQHKEQNIPY